MNIKRLVSSLMIFIMILSSLLVSEASPAIQPRVNYNMVINIKGGPIFNNLQYNGASVLGTSAVYEQSPGVEFPAYCLQPLRKGVGEYPTGNYDVNVDGIFVQPKVVGMILNGHPYKTPAEMGLDTELEAHEVTKAAVWTALQGSPYPDIDKWTSSDPKFKTALVKLYNEGIKNTTLFSQNSLTATPVGNKAVTDQYTKQTYKVESNFDINGNYFVTLKGSYPAGTVIQDESGNAKTSFSPSDKFVIYVPTAGLPANTSGTVEVEVSADLKSKVVFYGAPIDLQIQSGKNYQDYIISSTKQYTNTKTNLAYTAKDSSLPQVPDEEGKITIYKYEHGTQTPLAGAQFRVTDATGGVIGVYSTNSSGKIEVEVDKLGAYYVEEIAPPSGYVLDEINHKDIVVRADQPAVVSFTNKKSGKLIITKYDEKTGMLLDGAEFSLKKKDGSIIWEGMVSGGRIEIDSNLDEGWYSITEIAPPSGYLIATESKDVYIENGKTATVKFDNRPAPILELQKVDKTTGEPLAGAKFKVIETESQTVSEYITNSTGTIIITDLLEKIYTIQEITAPDGYILDPEIKNIQLEWGKTKTLIFENEKKPTLVFEKTNGLTGKGIPGATFKVEYEAPNGGIINLGTFKSDSDGKIIIPDVEVGWYIVTEILPAPGYQMPTKPSTRFYLSAGQNAYVISSPSGSGSTTSNPPSTGGTQTPNPTSIVVKSGNDYMTNGGIINYPLNSVVIKKTDAITGELLEGAAFELYKADGQQSGVPGTNIGRYTTDNSGIIVITGLESGYYVVKEVQAPTNYLISENSQQNGFLKPDGTTVLEFTFANFPYGSLLISKVDALTNLPLSGAKFKVTDSQGTAVGNANGEYITDTNGEILISNLKPGAYVIIELIAPTGYVIDTTPQTIHIGTDGKTYKVSFQNQPIGGIVIKKYDTDTKEPLANAEFKVTNAKGEVIGNNNGIFKSDINGSIIISDLPKGTYVIEEIKAPDGYVLTNQTQTIEVDYGKTYTVDFYNSKFATIVIKKYDTDTKQPLANAEFKVTNSKGEVIGNSNGIFKTDVNGAVTISGLAKDSYILQEIKAPDGYVLTNQTQTIAIDTAKTYTVDFYNSKKSGLQIIKIDATTKEALKHAKFNVYKKSGDLIGSYETDGNGLIILPELEPGWYKIAETKAPDGYQIDETPKDIEVKTNQFIKVVFENKKLPNAGIVIIKTDMQTRKPLAGVKFDIRKSNGEKIDTLKTDKNGKIYVNDLPAGKYIVQEVEALDGYELDTEEYRVTLKEGQQERLEIQNRPLSGLRIHKIDSITKQGIYNVEFMVFDHNNKVVGTFYSDNNGVVDFPAILVGGRYTIRETRAANGYYRDDVPRTVEFISGKVTEITWENIPEAGQIQVTKISADDNETNGLPKGTHLEGAIFEVYSHKSGNIVDKFITGTDGRGVSKPLPLGRYTVKEVQAPTFYKLNTAPMDVTVEFATQIIKLEFANESANVGVSIDKVGPKEVMQGQEAMYTIKKVRNDSSVPLDSFYWRDMLPVDAVRLGKIVTGTYNQSLKYKVTGLTSKGNTIILADNLMTTKNNVIDCSNASLGLPGDEYITSFSFQFGTVKAGFMTVEEPKVYVNVLNSNLPNNYQFANKVDVGGKQGTNWIVGNSTALTAIHNPQGSKLPKTGK